MAAPFVLPRDCDGALADALQECFIARRTDLSRAECQNPPRSSPGGQVYGSSFDTPAAGEPQPPADGRHMPVPLSGAWASVLQPPCVPYHPYQKHSYFMFFS